MVTEGNTWDDESCFLESAPFAIKDMKPVLQLVTSFVTHFCNMFLTLFVLCYSHSFYVSMSSKTALTGLTTAVRAIETIIIMFHKDCSTFERFLTCQQIHCLL